MPPAADCRRRRPASAPASTRPRRSFRRHRRVVVERVEQELVGAVRLPAPLRPEAEQDDVAAAVVGVERGRLALNQVRAQQEAAAAADCDPSGNSPAPCRGNPGFVSNTGLRSNITADVGRQPGHHRMIRLLDLDAQQRAGAEELILAAARPATLVTGRLN